MGNEISRKRFERVLGTKLLKRYILVRDYTVFRWRFEKSFINMYR